MGSAKKRPGEQLSTAQDWSRAHRVVAMHVYRESEAYDLIKPLEAREEKLPVQKFEWDEPELQEQYWTILRIGLRRGFVAMTEHVVLLVALVTMGSECSEAAVPEATSEIDTELKRVTISNVEPTAPTMLV